jgi:hypothetical protein
MEAFRQDRMRPHISMKPSYNTIREATQNIICQLDKKARNRKYVFNWMGNQNTPEWKVKNMLTFRLAIELWDEWKGFTVTRPPRPQSDSKPSATDNVAGGPSKHTRTAARRLTASQLVDHLKHTRTAARQLTSQ